MTERQLAHSVHNGRRVTLVLDDDAEITGYIAGWDDDALLVLVPTAADGEHQQIVARTSVRRVRLHTESTWEQEPGLDGLEKTMGPFRRWVRKNMLGLQTDQ